MPPPGVRSVREAGLGVNGNRKGIGESSGFGFVEDGACVGAEYGDDVEVDGRGGTWEANDGFPGIELRMLDVEGPGEDDVPRREESRPVVVSGTFEGSGASSGDTAMDPETARQPSSTLCPPIEVSRLCITPSTAPSPSTSSSDGLEPAVGTWVPFPVETLQDACAVPTSPH